MNMKKVTVMACVSVALLVMCTVPVMAYDDCTTAEVLKVGAAAGVGGGATSDNVIAVKCTSDTTWGSYAQFYPNAAIGDQALATALTALSLGKTVWVRVSSKTSGSMLNTIYLNN